MEEFRGDRSLNKASRHDNESDASACKLVLAGTQSLLTCMLTLGNRFIGRQLLHLPVKVRPMAGDKDNHASLKHERLCCIDKLKLCISIDVHGILRISRDQLRSNPPEALRTTTST